MAKSILGCFLFASCYSQTNSSHISSKDLKDLYSCSEDLNQLSRSFSHGSVSLKWSVEAMKILKKTQVELLILVKKSNIPITKDGNRFNQYMIDSIKLLDFCNSLKFIVSNVNQYRMMVDVIITKLDRSDSSDIREFKSQKYSTLGTVIETVGQFEGMSIEDKSIKSVTVAISMLLHSALVSSVSTEQGGSDLACKYHQLKPFIEMPKMLVQEFDERDSTIKNGSGSELVEHEIVARVMVDIQAQMIHGIEDKERFLSSLDLLRTSLVELKEGIEKLDSAVDDVFDVIIRGRSEMLGVLRDGDLYIG